MRTSKLDMLGATYTGAMLAESVLRIQAKHNLTDGDAIAVITVAFTRILELKIGEAATVEFCRAHADELERGLLEGMPPAPIGKGAD